MITTIKNIFTSTTKKRPRVNRVCSSSHFKRSLRQYRRYQKSMLLLCLDIPENKNK